MRGEGMEGIRTHWWGTVEDRVEIQNLQRKYHTGFHIRSTSKVSGRECSQILALGNNLRSLRELAGMYKRGNQRANSVH